MKLSIDVTDSSTQSKPFSHRCCTWLKSLANSLERARTRRLLGQLNERELSDLGISHADRLHEWDKPFWR